MKAGSEMPGPRRSRLSRPGARGPRSRTRGLAPVVLLALAAGPVAVGSEPPSVRAERTRIEARLAAAGWDDAAIVWSAGTPRVEMLGFGNRPGPRVRSSPAAPAPERARAFLGEWGRAFGVPEVERLVLEDLAGPDALGMEHVRFRQTVHGIPVAAGQVGVHLRGTEIRAVAARVATDLGTVARTPTLDASTASALVRELERARTGVPAGKLSAPRLEVLDRSLFEEGGRFPARLAWRIEVSDGAVGRLYWLDAATGVVLLDFDLHPTARVREVFDALSDSSLPGVLARSEGEPATGDPEVDAAYDFSGDTYDYFAAAHGRDGIDGQGGSIRTSVRFCPSAESCPWFNAFWSGSEALSVFGSGLVTDDVVGHEAVHGITEATADLYYYMQSGALNESFSDVFGELVDLWNGEDDPGDRWLIGEDVIGGPIRDMADPPSEGDPGKLSDPEVDCGMPGDDNGGVHTNSGVPNHAFVLAADGGAFNGFVISGIGTEKAGRVWYRALSVYLVQGSGFRLADAALRQSCADLVGSDGITVADCDEVAAALDAVEMSIPWPCAQALHGELPAPCPEGEGFSTIYYSDHFPPAEWFRAGCNHRPELAVAGSRSMHCPDGASADDDWVVLWDPVAVPAGGAFYDFSHLFGFHNEGGAFYDGGRILRSGVGPTSGFAGVGGQIVAGAALNGTLEAGTGNPFAGSDAFVGHSFGYVSTRVDLGNWAGQDQWLAWATGSDASVGDLGWYLDEVRIFECATTRVADLAIAVDDGLTSAVPGEPITWTLVVSNLGPETARGLVYDDFPDEVNSCSWTAVFAGGASGTASGTGTIRHQPVDLPAGGSVTYTATCTVKPQSTGTLVNVATVIPDGFVEDGDAANDVASDVDTVLVPTADLSISKTDGLEGIGSGEATTYTLVVANAGPSDIVGASVQDTFPSELEACSWTCAPDAESSCTPGPVAGDLADTVDLPAGSAATYTVGCTVAPGAETVLNLATISVPGGSVESAAGDNTASDRTDVFLFADGFESGDTSAWGT